MVIFGYLIQRSFSTKPVPSRVFSSKPPIHKTHVPQTNLSKSIYTENLLKKELFENHESPTRKYLKKLCFPKGSINSTSQNHISIPNTTGPSG